MARRDEITHEFEAKIVLTTPKSRLIEETMTGEKFFLPKSQNCTIDFNPCDDEGNFMFVVSDWWFKKKDDFRAE